MKYSQYTNRIFLKVNFKNHNIRFNNCLVISHISKILGSTQRENFWVGF